MKELKRNNDEVIRVDVKEYKEQKYLDIRLFFKGTKEVGGLLGHDTKTEDTYFPSKRGICLPIEEARGLAILINDVLLKEV